MSDVKDTTREIHLREKIAARSANADDYLELASLLFDTMRFEESVETLRQALRAPFDNVPRASLLIALGWYVYGVTGGVLEPRELGEQALKLIEPIESVEASVARGKALYLVAVFVFPEDPARAKEMAGSALSILDPLLEGGVIPESESLYDVLLASANLNGLVGRFDAASSRCRQAFKAASDRNQKLNSLLELATSYRMGSRLNEARSVLAEAILYRDGSPLSLVRLYYELGMIERALGRDAEARAKLRKAIDILESNPALPRDQMPEILRYCGEISYDLEDMGEAAKSFQGTVDHSAPSDPFHWNSLLWLAYAQHGSGQNEAARENATLVKRSLTASDEDRANADHLLETIKTDSG